MSETILNFILRLIELLKPKFYNKITYVLVITGISLMSTPLWISIVNVIFEESFNTSITGESDTSWGFALCCLGVVYHLTSTALFEYLTVIKETLNKEKTVKQVEHDVSIFETLNEALDEEYLFELMTKIRTDDAIYWEEYQTLFRYQELSRQSGNTFLESNVVHLSDTFSKAVSSFTDFIMTKFDQYPYDQTRENFRMCLAPQLNVDRAGQWENSRDYEVLVQKMLNHISCIEESYKNFRAAVKQSLLI